MVSKASELLGSTFPVLLTRPFGLHGYAGIAGAAAEAVIHPK